jgi:putative oxidoreductase
VIVQELIFGLGASELALAVPRVAVGTFFLISGGHKLCLPERHAALVKTLQADKVPAVGFMQWWVPGCEVVAGLCLTVGLFSASAAAVLFAIMLVACWCEAREKVASYKPVNRLDAVDDYLYLPEVLYLGLLTVTLLAGPGAYSLDHLIWK